MDLMNPVSRKYWDSIDPTIDESIPDFNAEGEFFSTYGPVFEREARFSLIPDVPSLGTIEDSREKIQKFYDFWVNFKTWRTFSNPAAVKDLVNPEKYV